MTKYEDLVVFIVDAYSRANLADWDPEVVAEELESIYNVATADDGEEE